MRELLDRAARRRTGSPRSDDPAAWAPVDEIPDGELWATRERQRAELVEFVRERSMLDRLSAERRARVRRGRGARLRPRAC